MKYAKPLRRLVLLGIAICAAFLCVSVVSAALLAAQLQSQKQRAHQQCQVIERAARAALWSSRSPGSPEEEEQRLPTLPHLVGTNWAVSYLPNGMADTIDPWGKPYRMEWSTATDGTPSVLISTTAPDGTPISQFGIGESLQPR